MSDPELEDFLILRNVAEPIAEDTFRAGAEAAMDALQNHTDEDVGSSWEKSHVRTEADGPVVGTMCQYRAEDEAALRKRADRAGLPVTRIDRHGKTVEHAS